MESSPDNFTKVNGMCAAISAKRQKLEEKFVLDVMLLLYRKVLNQNDNVK